MARVRQVNSVEGLKFRARRAAAGRCLNRRAFLKRAGLMIGGLMMASNSLWWPRSTLAQDSPGTLKWKFQAGGPVFSSPAMEADGTIYFGSGDESFYALSPDGSLKWKFLTGSVVWSSPTIGMDGTIYLGSDDGYLYAIDSGTGQGLANSSWPMFHHDPQHTGRVGTAAPYMKEPPADYQPPQEREKGATASLQRQRPSHRCCDLPELELAELTQRGSTKMSLLNRGHLIALRPTAPLQSSRPLG